MGILKKLTLCALLFGTSSVHAYTELGVIAPLSPGAQRTVSDNVPTTAATQTLKTGTQNSNFIYWLSRNRSQSYHVTLDLISRVDGAAFTQGDEQHIEAILNNFNTYAKNLNAKQRKGQKCYLANGYELRLFVHYTDGTHEQFDANNINALPARQKDVSYANLVLKIGTHGQIRDDWQHVQNTVLTRPNHAAYQRNANHTLETHLTIASLYKYSKAQNKIVQNANGRTEVKRKNGKSGWNEPFDATDIDVLVDVFNDTHNATQFGKLVDLRINRMQLTAKQNGVINTVSTVNFR